MADLQGLATDENGVITSGRFQGHKLADVLQYAESLEQAAAVPPPAEPARPATPDPVAALAAHAAERVDTSTALLMQRLEADDEAAFAATVPDYEKYRKQIADIKAQMPPQQRMQKGVHYFVYSMIKAGTDPTVKAAILNTPATPPAEPEEPAAETPAEPAVPPPAAAPAGRSESVPAPKPKAVPPAAAPTPSARKAAEPTARKPKLVATEKITRQARAFGMSIEDYLFRLEDQGITQDEISTAEARTPRNARRETVYDRALR